MKKWNTFFLWLAVVFILFSISCKKNAETNSSSADEQLIKNAKIYFDQTTTQSPNNNNPDKSERTRSPKSPNWQGAYIMQLSLGKAVIVPVKFKDSLFIRNNFGGPKLVSLNDLTRLLIYKDQKGIYHSELITLMPDSIYYRLPGMAFSGIILVEDWSNNFLKEFKYQPNGSISKYNKTNLQQEGRADQPIKTANSNPVTPELILTIDYYLEGFNYSAEDEGGASWSEYLGSSVYYFPDDTPGDGGTPSGGDYGGIGGGGGGSGTGTGNTITITRGNNIIANIADYNKCFTNYGGSDHKYQVTVCVNQPIPGSRSPWTTTSGGPIGSSGAGNPVSVGHTFLIFSEVFNDHSIVRNVGFYPQNSAVPWSTSDQGQLNNDAGHEYDISLTINVDNGQFFNMLNFVAQGNNPGYLYDLNSNNCTTFALHTLAAGGVILPSTVGTWPDNGNGNNPGDLGEDIRSLSLPPTMTRNTVENAHPNNGSCN